VTLDNFQFPFGLSEVSCQQSDPGCNEFLVNFPHAGVLGYQADREGGSLGPVADVVVRKR
jgi:hypothetical protein